MASVLGIDLGGTKTLMGRYDAATLKFQRIEKFPTHANKNFDHVKEDLIDQIASLRSEDTVAIGIGVPGLVDQRKHAIITMPNIPGAEGFDLRAFLAQRTSLQVIVDNDVHCFALGEALFGAGRDHAIVIGVTLGTGVGGGVVIDGKIFYGAHGFAGELGHMLLQPGNPPYDTKDKRGDVEQFFSGTALARRCAAAKEPHDVLAGDACAFLHPELYRELAWFCTNLTYAFDPSIIIIGGSVGRSLADHLPQIRKEMKKWVMKGTPLPELALASLDDAAVRGAAHLAQTLI